jgi:hypothetical protein
MAATRRFVIAENVSLPLYILAGCKHAERSVLVSHSDAASIIKS